jgi:hypothetical protein
MPAPLPDLRAQSLAELARLMIRNDTCNMLTAVDELRARKAIVCELIRRGVLKRPAAPRKVDSLAYKDTTLPLIIEALERLATQEAAKPARMFIVEAEHYSVPGRLVSAHATHESAIKKAVELANIILKDAGAKKPATAQDYEARIEALSDRKVENGLSPCYVDISEHAVEQ